jgi:hypothetical protein
MTQTMPKETGETCPSSQRTPIPASSSNSTATIPQAAAGAKPPVHRRTNNYGVVAKSLLSNPYYAVRLPSDSIDPLSSPAAHERLDKQHKTEPGYQWYLGYDPIKRCRYCHQLEIRCESAHCKFYRDISLPERPPVNESVYGLGPGVEAEDSGSGLSVGARMAAKTSNIARCVCQS